MAGRKTAGHEIVSREPGIDEIVTRAEDAIDRTDREAGKL